MSRLHIHVAVRDIEQNLRFYNALFGREPAVHRDDYAKWELEDPAVNFAISTHGLHTGLDHVGIQAGSDAELAAIRGRLERAGIDGTAQENTSCCYARSDKYWTTDPQGIAWESFHTLESIPVFREATENKCCAPARPGGCC